MCYNMEIALENKLFYYYILPTARIVINTRKGSTPESRMTFPTGLVMGECKKTLWATSKMFRYRQQDFLFLIIEFSDGKLKQKVFFHSDVVLMASARKRASCCCLSVACIQTVALHLFYSFKSFSCQVLPNKKNHSSLRLLCAEIFPRQLSLLVYCRTYALHPCIQNCLENTPKYSKLCDEQTFS